MEKPDYLAEAKSLYIEGPWGKCIDINNLEKALKRMWEMGYRYAVVHDWSIEFDKSISQEDVDQAYREGIEDTLKGYKKI